MFIRLGYGYVSTKHPKQNSKTPDFIRVLGFFFISNLDEQLDEC